VSGLALGDYLLWNWSLAGGHGVLALVSGLTLPPLALACVWLLTLNLVRLIARSTQRSRVRAGGRRSAERRDPGRRTRASRAAPGREDPATGSPATAPAATAAASSSSAAAATSSGKLAA